MASTYIDIFVFGRSLACWGVVAIRTVLTKKAELMKITTIEFLPLQLTISQSGSPLGTDSSTREQKDASAEALAAQRYW